MVLVKSVSNWNSELFEKFVLTLVLASTGIQLHVGLSSKLNFKGLEK